MKILIVGNGGREHTIAYMVFHSPSFQNTGSKLFCTTGNPGINSIAEPVDIKPADIGKILNYVKENEIGFTIVGPELPLSLGIADKFEENNLKIFGPSAKAAEIETSKVFAKDFMARNNIPTAEYQSFNSDEINSAKEFALKLGFPVVVKADGLAAGKGVIIVNDMIELQSVLIDFTVNKVFGESGINFVIEQFLQGFELSIFVITDGVHYKILPASQDHKKIGDNDTGKNTGGMGAYAPADFLIDEKLWNKIESSVINPAIEGLRKEGRTYKGCLYCGLMILTDSEGIKNPYVIEFNCRFGDPEAQAVLPLINSDFLELLKSSAENRISGYNLITGKSHACCVVLASDGYPDKYETGKLIEGLDKTDDNCIIFHSGTKKSAEEVLTNGGRVLSVVGISDISLKDAVQVSYKNVKKIHFENKYFRKDIGRKGLIL